MRRTVKRRCFKNTVYIHRTIFSADADAFVYISPMLSPAPHPPLAPPEEGRGRGSSLSVTHESFLLVLWLASCPVILRVRIRCMSCFGPHRMLRQPYWLFILV